MTDFLFCFLKPDARRHAINQRRHYLICRRDGCGYLDESGAEGPRCTCEPTIEYFLSFKDGNKKKQSAEIATEESEPREVASNDQTNQAEELGEEISKEMVERQAL